MLLKECVEEDERVKNKKKAKVDYYRDLMHRMGEDTEKMNEWAARRTCRVYNCTEEKLKEDIEEVKKMEEEEKMNAEVLTEETLSEATLGDVTKAAQELDAVVDDSNNKSTIERVLDRALKRNLAQKRQGKDDYQNILLVGEAGTGKSSIVRQWAKDNGINLFEVRAAGMDDTDLGGAISPSKDYSTVVRLASTEFDKLDRPNSVLFLDEYNRAPKSVRTNLLELVNSHVVPDNREPSGQRKLNNFLFTVAAINPANPNYDTDKMDVAEISRFKRIDVLNEPLVLLRHLEKEFNHDLEIAEDDEEKLEIMGRLDLAKTLLTSKDFEFDSTDEVAAADEKGDQPLNYRTFKAALLDSDGTKEDLLDVWSSWTNPDKARMVKDILKNYVDVKDKANDVLKRGTTSKIFKKEKSMFDSLFDNIDDVEGLEGK